jgi:hypothetical protein
MGVLRRRGRWDGCFEKKGGKKKQRSVLWCGASQSALFWPVRLFVACYCESWEEGASFLLAFFGKIEGMGR